MALISSVLGLKDAVGNSNTIDATTSSSAIALIPNADFAINATEDMAIRFTASAGVTEATSSDFRIPQNQTFTFHVPAEITTMYLYNLNSGSSLTYYWTYLNKF